MNQCNQTADEIHREQANTNNLSETESYTPTRWITFF